MKDYRNQQTGGSFTAEDFNLGLSDLANFVEQKLGALNPNDPNQVLQALDATYVQLTNLAAKTSGASGSSLVGHFDAYTDGSQQKTVKQKLDELAQVSDIKNQYNIVNLIYPIGFIVQTAGSSIEPPSPGGIRWEEQTQAEGHFVIGANSTTALPVDAGEAAGTLHTTDPMTLSNMIAHTHKFKQTGGYQFLNETTGGNKNYQQNAVENIYTSETKETTEEEGATSPQGLGLTNVRRYGVVLWKRISDDPNWLNGVQISGKK